MNREEFKLLRRRAKTDRKFRRLLLGMLCALVWVPSSAKDRLAACRLADHLLRTGGAAWRRELKRRLKARGWEF
jgi:hypothetical protein